MHSRLALLAQTGAAGLVAAAGLLAAPTVIEKARNEGPETAASHELFFHRSSIISPATIDELRKHRFVVIDNAISEDILQAAQADHVQLRNFLRPTGQHGNTRSDSIAWIAEGDKTLQQSFGLRCALRRLRGLALQLETASGGSWTGFGDDHNIDGAGTLGVPPGAQLACYPRAVEGADPVRAATGGARYIPHRDGVERARVGLRYALAEPAHCMRECTCILYLTDEAAGDGQRPPPPLPGARPTREISEVGAAAGGALVLHLGADARDTTGLGVHTLVEILPVGGRLVLFDSRTVLHEVRPHTRTDVDRVAMTLWLGGPYDTSSLLRFCSTWWWPSR